MAIRFSTGTFADERKRAVSAIASGNTAEGLLAKNVLILWPQSTDRGGADFSSFAIGLHKP